MYVSYVWFADLLFVVRYCQCPEECTSLFCYLAVGKKVVYTLIPLIPSHFRSLYISQCVCVHVSCSGIASVRSLMCVNSIKLGLGDLGWGAFRDVRLVHKGTLLDGGRSCVGCCWIRVWDVLWLRVLWSYGCRCLSCLWQGVISRIEIFAFLIIIITDAGNTQT